MLNKKEEELHRAIKHLVDEAYKEDRIIRDEQIRQWKKLKLYWDGFQRIYFSEVAHDWRNPPENSDYSGYYDKQINVLQAYGESIIAALSVTVPGIKCYPDDADNQFDIVTAKAGDKIAELIARHNDSILLWIRALFIYCTEGMVAAYNYSKTDKSYGTYDTNEYEKYDEDVTKSYCPRCGVELVDENVCPNCMEEIHNPEQKVETIVNERLVGVTNKAKSRQCIEVFGGLYVKVPIYASKQEDCSYLIYSYETHWTNAKHRYPDLEITGGKAADEDYDRWGRNSSQYREIEPENNVTVKNVWIRPSWYRNCRKEETEKLLKEYPNGLKVVMVDDHVADVNAETLDEHWTITQNPTSDFIYTQPLVARLVNIQDITNDMVSIVLQTAEHGIPQTFADPDVLDFAEYEKTEVSPGTIYPVTPRTGRSIGESFYEVKTATLSREIEPFIQRIQEFGQLVSGALPSLFGGPAAGSSRTASEYAMSRAQALQRLQTPWKMLTVWWRQIYAKCIPSYINEIVADERFVEKDEAGNFINIFIRRAELEGKIGRIETDASDQLPITFAQKKEALMELLGIQHPAILEAITAPENISLLTQILGVPEFKLPNQDVVEKQYEEIYLLVQSEPLDEVTPSVQIELDLDNHELEAEICRKWLISPIGRAAKTDNPAGYQNVLLHLKQHMTFLQGMQAAPSPPMPPQEGPQPPEGLVQPPIPMEEGIDYGPGSAESIEQFV